MQASPDTGTTDAALALLDRLSPPDGAARFMLWVHYQDPHGPYTPPEVFAQKAAALEPEAGRLEVLGTNHGGPGIPAYQALGERREVAWYRAAYRGEVAYVDSELGRLLDGVAARGLADATLVVLTADHGEALGEHDVWFAHGHDLTEELVRVPLLLRDPGAPPARRSDVVTLVDLHTTLLRRLTGEAPGGGPGRDLLAPGAEDVASLPFLETIAYSGSKRVGLVADDYKLILTWREGVWQARLFRRGREDVDFSASAPQVAAALRDRLGELQAGFAALRPDVLNQELSPEVRARLEALGYLDGED
jgi:arylsulfatase A-like enzyme